jgi:hypothetical protein
MRRLESVPCRAGGIRWRVVEGEVVLIDPDEGELVRFNEIGSHIWQAIDGQSTVAQIVDHICDTFDVGRRRAQKDVTRFLRNLQRQELIQGRDGGLS